jgi:tripartite-type tricarboxylate transporter receptor subunit TctC
MSTLSHWIRTAFLAGALGIAAASAAQAQVFPARPIRIILGYSTGGTADNLGRVIAERLGARLGQSVLIENRPGASGNIAALAVANAAPDGYTLLFGNTAEMAINKHIMKDMAFNPDADFAPVALIHNVPLGLIVAAKSPYRSLGEMLEAARAAPGRLTLANSGTGSPAHLAGEMLMACAKVKMVQVPYKGAAPPLRAMFPPWPSRACPVSISACEAAFSRRWRRRRTWSAGSMRRSASR